MSVEEKPLIINISSLSPEGSESDIDAKPRNSGSGCDNVNGIIGSASSECGLRGSQTRVQNIGSPPSLEGLQSGSNSSSNSNSSSSSSSSSSSNDNDVPIPESIFFMYPRPLTKFQRVLVILSVWCVVIVFFVVLFSVFAIVWYLVTKRSILSIVLFAGFLCLCFVPRKVHIWPNYTANKVFQLWAAYFDFAVVSEAKALSPSHKYIFADFPHGIFPAGLFFSQVNININI